MGRWPRAEGSKAPLLIREELGFYRHHVIFCAPKWSSRTLLCASLSTARLHTHTRARPVYLCEPLSCTEVQNTIVMLRDAEALGLTACKNSWQALTAIIQNTIAMLRLL